VRLAEDVPGNRPLFSLTETAVAFGVPGDDAPYVRVQRSAAERRANRLAGLRKRRVANQSKSLADQVAAVARRQRGEKRESGVGPFEAGVVEQRTNNVLTEKK